MKEILEFDVDGLIRDLISEGYRKTIGTFRAPIPTNLKPNIDLDTAIFIFDRLNESSLLAAAILKRYGDAKVFEYEQIDKIVFDANTHVVWLNLQPILFIAKKMRCKHSCFIGNQFAKPIWPSVRVFSDVDVDSVAEQVITHILFPAFEERLNKALDLEENEATREAMKAESDLFVAGMKLWFGVGYLVEIFHTKVPNEEQIVKAFSVIRMAHEYLYYDAKWKPEVTLDSNAMEQEAAYRVAVEDSKKLLEKNLQTRHSFYGGKIIATHYITETSYRWYIMKRLIEINGQIWKSPLTVAERLFFGDNMKQKVAA